MPAACARSTAVDSCRCAVPLCNSSASRATARLMDRCESPSVSVSWSGKSLDEKRAPARKLSCWATEVASGVCNCLVAAPTAAISFAVLHRPLLQGPPSVALADAATSHSTESNAASTTALLACKQLRSLVGMQLRSAGMHRVELRPHSLVVLTPIVATTLTPQLGLCRRD